MTAFLGSLATAIGLVGSILILYYRSKWQVAELHAVAWQAQSSSLTRQLVDVTSAAADSAVRFTRQINECQTSRQQIRDTIAQMAKAHPELVRDYFDLMLRGAAAAGGTDPPAGMPHK